MAYLQNHSELAQMAWQAPYTYHATRVSKISQFGDTGLKKVFCDLTWNDPWLILPMSCSCC